MTEQTRKNRLLALTADIVAAHVANNSTTTDSVPSLITSVFETLANVGVAAAEPERPEPAVPVRKSVFSDRIICLDCGKKFSMIKRHLQTDHQMTPEAYRAKWGLADNYPLVAPDYAAKRSALAKSIGLGRKREEKAIAPEPKQTAPKAAKPKAAATSAKGAKPKKAT